MRERIEAEMIHFIQEYQRTLALPHLWQQPIIKYGDAFDPRFQELSQAVGTRHHLPQDYLPKATTVLSYFLPFQREVAVSNQGGGTCSPLWAQAYLYTNTMAAALHRHLVEYIRTLGFEAAIPTGTGMISHQEPRSHWSQRHVAYLAGQGTFGLNNMLISDRGCVGRYFSLVTTLPLAPDPVVTAERCLYKRNGTCGQCVNRCPVEALTVGGFDRFRCLDQCLINDRLFPGADVCGKCVVDVPCSFAIP